ncbi:gamma-glutamyl-gamma-aminobutyrate hydrolase family protein [Legionella israelensis]|uniref:Glutamine amidotransferase n=1 Tax=Legionella israelensis TaxID=454 RepID=A0A0W0VEH9_9GAMM|nr:gamma-glutamyl-gamma-aminobutyrate hydrolase family protein [Legionella israelensis]KTD18522.1 glutamine amidotransferase [Legionella israelensis]QBS10452.1 gamma-glutamyl-gamma-aminobutyrate hydrolase family protein [Legionella israelensis]SCY47816.1 putative glutamine amidotransferase [Legionella israelensis DSM 19235]STX60076.1 glutamine amidotransferase [Legionella israelensis]
MNNRPVIAITHSVKQSRTVIFFVKFAIWLAGGKPKCITAKKNSNFFDYDGLVLCGGVDINPELYEETKKTGYPYEPERDELELAHLTFAEKKNIPVFGLCRGCQLMNIFRSGKLHLDITKAYEKAQYPSNLIGYIFFRKKIYIKQGSKLFLLIQKPEIKVNSLHKQSISQLGRDLVITASEKNKIVQCIEDPRKQFFLGVQFHPEFLIYKKCFRNLFKALVRSTTL